MKKILITLCAITALYSCQDAQEIVQPSEFGFDTAFQTPEDVKTAIFGVYGEANYLTHISWTSQFTDECSLGSAGNNGSDTHRLQVNVNNGLADALWLANYQAIVRANIILEGSNFVESDSAEGDALIAEAQAEALALRAYAHTQLLAYFSQDLSDRESPAAIIVDFIPSQDDRLPRNTTGEVIDFINQDLEDAEALLRSAGTAYDVNFVSLSFIDALRARANAYVGNYTIAGPAASRVIADFTLPATADEDSYREVWQDVSGTALSQEVIFKFDNTLAVSGGGRIGQIFNTNASNAGGAPLYEVGRRLFDILDSNKDNFGDIRRDIWIDSTSIIVADYANDPNPQQNDRIVVDKYPGDPSLPGLVGGYTNDQKVFRTVEMHFILAEAAVVNNDLPGAAAQIKRIRDTRYTSQQPAPVYASPTAAWSDILLERYVELFAEGHRYVDVKRLGALANQGLDRNETDCSLYPANECDLPFSDFRVRALPIPADEVAANPGIQQNTGY